MLSILSESLSHIFFNFDDEQKNLIDCCTTDYIDRVTLQGEYQYPIEHPYILKTLSNLLDAQRILAAGKRSDFSAFFVDGGEIHEAVDSENSLS